MTVSSNEEECNVNNNEVLVVDDEANQEILIDSPMAKKDKQERGKRGGRKGLFQDSDDEDEEEFEVSQEFIDQQVDNQVLYYDKQQRQQIDVDYIKAVIKLVRKHLQA